MSKNHLLFVLQSHAPRATHHASHTLQLVWLLDRALKLNRIKRINDYQSMAHPCAVSSTVITATRKENKQTRQLLYNASTNTNANARVKTDTYTRTYRKRPDLSVPFRGRSRWGHVSESTCSTFCFASCAKTPYPRTRNHIEADLGPAGVALARRDSSRGSHWHAAAQLYCNMI